MQNCEEHCSSDETFAKDHIYRGDCCLTGGCSDYDAPTSTGCGSFAAVQQHDLHTEGRTAHPDVHAPPAYISGFYGREGLAIRACGCKGVFLSLAKSAVRFFIFGTNCGRHFWLRPRTRRYSNPRNAKLPPVVRSMVRLLPSLISTRSFASSSRSRLSTALMSQSFRRWESINITMSSANRAYCTWVYFPRRVVHEKIRETELAGQV